MQKVIGLDIGSYSIKAVEIVNTFKSYEITNFYENVIPHLEGVPLDTIVPSCMEQLFKENQLEADRIVTAMPGQFISSRALSFNFADPKKIQLAVYSEVEEAVPFNMDDMIMDHQILGTMGGKTFALAVMTRKAFLKNFLDLLLRIDIDPKLVDVDSLAFYNLSSYMNVDPGECFAMVDVGHEKTSVCIVRDGVLRMFRSINLGGRYVTEFLARDLEANFHEAQRLKHEVSRVTSSDDHAEDATGQEKFVIDRMTLACNAIIKELGRTFYSFKTWEKQPLSRVFLSGGASQVKNFDTFLMDQLEVDVVRYRLDDTDLKLSPDLASYMSVMPQSVAIGMRSVASVKRHSQINLRTGEFSYVQNYEVVMKYGMNALRFLGVVCFLLMMSYGFKYWNYSGKIDALQTEYKAQYKKIFPKQSARMLKANVPFKAIKNDAEKKLRGEITKKNQAIQNFVTANTGSPALVVLKEISENIPKDVTVDVTLYQFKAVDGGGKLTLKAETDNYDSQAKIIDAIKKAPSLMDVKESNSGAKPGSNGKVIQFTLQASYTVPQS